MEVVQKQRRPHRATTVSHEVGIVSDIHFPFHRRRAWAAWLHWLEVNKPSEVVVLGDALDLSIMGRFDKSGNEPAVVDEILVLVEQMNKMLSLCGKLTYSMGNHEARYAKFLQGASAHVLRGLRGLTLHDQCRAWGLDERVIWHEESVETGAIS